MISMSMQFVTPGVHCSQGGITSGRSSQAAALGETLLEGSVFPLWAHRPHALSSNTHGLGEVHLIAAALGASRKSSLTPRPGLPSSTPLCFMSSCGVLGDPSSLRTSAVRVAR